MRVLSLKPGHDGSAAFIEDGQLIYSIEAEKDSFVRYGELSASLMAQAAEMAPGPPDMLAIGGWHKSLPGHHSRIGSGYNGLDRVSVADGRFFGTSVKVFSSSHERSHLYSTAALAPRAPIEECVILVWEGVLGAFYHWQEYGAKISRVHVLSQPGARYAALFGLADPSFPDSGCEPRMEDAGKLMALAAYGDVETLTPDERATVEGLLAPESMYPFDKSSRQGSPLYNCGVDTPACQRAARYLTDRIFDIFYQAAQASCPSDVPLLISGGCGLNCEWNRRWRACGLFNEVFVPPCANDSGSAIGTAIDAAVHFGEQCKLAWSVYAGAPFRHDIAPDSALWSTQPLLLDQLAGCLAEGRIVAWVQGRYEIGPRALGHRSLLASPLLASSKQVLNTIKGREVYRPIAPCCRYEELDHWFVSPVADPYMLYLSQVKTNTLPAITHADGTARLQSVRAGDVPMLHRLLQAFGSQTGYGVLCNTSLNYQGRGFINSMSELLAYCEASEIREVVVEDRW
ncbi:MAG: 3-hydroxymethylcephem carbamoyltransferase, partial [Actinobacteria bacterium]|nr:3-hydroxymethylcephem carbamoyltransferase [Actinomycetota bacterium]